MLSKANDRIEVISGDITKLSVAAIVNAGNESLLGGGGVDGAIHRAAGPRLLRHNKTLGGCPTGEAKITPSFDLAAHGIKHIIHTVGPVWHGDAEAKIGEPREDTLLAWCYDNSLALASQQEVDSIAFPAISTGVYGFPKTRAARIAVDRGVNWLKEHELPNRIVYCCFADADRTIYEKVIASG